ncbi:hypothetical protein ACIPYS_19375 [Kitasatospora sp. NPDC089913]|uniref:hypothetical protein n=1 Tax=Kitasatospora sp. NPDC089913 TaxID=3364080 RepID=UPI0037FB8929
MTPASDDIADFLRREFRSRGGVEVLEISVRAYPDETNYIVLVNEEDVPVSAQIGNDLDGIISSPESRAFVIVRKAPPELVKASSSPLTEGVQDSRATDLQRLISARSRVSEAQPSLSYIRDMEFNLSTVTASRHHLIFGRRGAGKTALLVEAKRKLQVEGAISCWVNMQTLRNESPDRVFLYILDEVAQAVVTRQQQLKPESVISVKAVELYEEVGRLLSSHGEVNSQAVMRIIPQAQRVLRRFLDMNDLRLYVFVDDFYYLPRADQPRILDMLHGAVRDCNAWLKIASIRHLTRWFQSSPPLGLQTMHDADLIDLDVTLQDPLRAKNFLESILHQYAKHVGIASLGRLFHPAALDRLVLASGAVPRDYLVLAGSAIAKAQRRQNARLVGVQDVNLAAGDAAAVKLQELEDDMAADVESATRTVSGLKVIRDFCLEETSFTYFLVRYRDKEDNPHLYSVITDLLDVRMIHLIDAGVSDAHAAGQRSEVYMLDLSQFSGSRLKQGIQVLDFSGGKIESRKTRTSEAAKTGNTPRQVIAILRAGPTFELTRLRELVAE